MGIEELYQIIGRLYVEIYRSQSTLQDYQKQIQEKDMVIKKLRDNESKKDT